MYLDAKLKEKHRVFADVDATTHIHIGTIYTPWGAAGFIGRWHIVAALVGAYLKLINPPTDSFQYFSTTC